MNVSCRCHGCEKLGQNPISELASIPLINVPPSILIVLGPHEKTCPRELANNKGADQPAHTRSLVSAFVICLLERFISRLAMSLISIFWLVSVAEQAGLNHTLLETPKTGFVTSRPTFRVALRMCDSYQKASYLGIYLFQMADCSHMVLTSGYRP